MQRTKLAINFTPYGGKRYYYIRTSANVGIIGDKSDYKRVALYLKVDESQYIDMMRRYGGIWMGQDIMFTNRIYAEKAIEWARAIELMNIIKFSNTKEVWK